MAAADSRASDSASPSPCGLSPKAKVEGPASSRLAIACPTVRSCPVPRSATCQSNPCSVTSASASAAPPRRCARTAISGSVRCAASWLASGVTRPLAVTCAGAAAIVSLAISSASPSILPSSATVLCPAIRRSSTAMPVVRSAPVPFSVTDCGAPMPSPARPSAALNPPPNGGPSRDRSSIVSWAVKLSAVGPARPRAVMAAPSTVTASWRNSVPVSSRNADRVTWLCPASSRSACNWPIAISCPVTAAVRSKARDSSPSLPVSVAVAAPDRSRPAKSDSCDRSLSRALARPATCRSASSTSRLPDPSMA